MDDGLRDKQMILYIANESGRIHYHYTHMYIDYCIDGVSNRNKYRER